MADELPAHLVEERQADVEDDEVEVGEVGRGAVHVPGLGVLDRLGPGARPVDADEVHAQLLRLLEDRKGDPRIVHPPGKGAP
jgi:hypothetical protein